MPSLARVHPTVLAARERFYGVTVTEVAAAVERERVVVVGMGWNPHVRRARRILQEAGVGYTYLGYGNYVSAWRKRLAVKMWAGWPTFPMVFVEGALIGGASDLEALRKSGELEKLLSQGA